MRRHADVAFRRILDNLADAQKYHRDKIRVVHGKRKGKNNKGRASLQPPLPYLRLRQLLHTTNKNTITITKTKNFICLNRVVKIVSSVFTSLLVILPLSLYMYIVRAIVSVCVLQRSLIFSFTTNTLFFTYFVF